MPVEVRSITFEWKLDGFRKLKPQKYTSDYFWTSERHPWCLAFYPFGYSESTSSKYVSLFLHAVYNDTFKQIYFARKEVTFEVSVHVGDVAVGPYSIYHDFVAQERNIGWPEFRLRSKLINAAKTDEAPILLKVLIQIPNVAMSVPTPNPLLDAVSTLLGNQTHNDVLFRVGDRELHAHMGTLAARSESFAALFSTGMESVDRTLNGRMVVEVTDFDYDVFFVMLRYLYTSSFDFRGCPKVKATNLFEIADKYNVQGLRDAMEDCIADNLMAHNVVKILFGLAYRYPSLHKVCVAYIGDHFREVRETGTMANVEWTDDDWQDYVELAKEIK